MREAVRSTNRTDTTTTITAAAAATTTTTTAVGATKRDAGNDRGANANDRGGGNTRTSCRLR